MSAATAAQKTQEGAGPSLVPFQFTPLPAGFFRTLSRRLSPGAILCTGIILEETYGRPRRKGQAPPKWARVTEQQLAEWTGLTDRAVRKAIDEAVKLGALAQRKDGRNNEYRALWDHFDEIPERPARKIAPPTEAEREKAKKTGTTVPVSLTCPLGMECPVEEATLTEDRKVIDLVQVIAAASDTGTPVPVSAPPANGNGQVRHRNSSSGVNGAPAVSHPPRTANGVTPPSAVLTQGGGVPTPPDPLRALIDERLAPKLLQRIDDAMWRDVRERLGTDPEAEKAFLALVAKKTSRIESYAFLRVLAAQAREAAAVLPKAPQSTAAAAPPTEHEQIQAIVMTLRFLNSCEETNVNWPAWKRDLDRARRETPALYHRALQQLDDEKEARR